MNLPPGKGSLSEGVLGKATLSSSLSLFTRRKFSKFVQEAYRRVRRVVGTHLVYWGIKRPYWYLLGIYLIYFRAPGTFTFRGRTFQYFRHLYGFTYLHERAVEVPIIWEKVQSYAGRRILEVGNCLSHFFSCQHTVVDKYEKADGVLNCDVVDFQPAEPYDLIVSISTLEHVGWDERPRDPKKVLVAFENLTNCLAPGGEMVITLPFGYNPELDRCLQENKIYFTQKHYLKRTSPDNKWREVRWDEIREAKYGTPFPYGNALLIGVIRRNTDGTLA